MYNMLLSLLIRVRVSVGSLDLRTNLFKDFYLWKDDYQFDGKVNLGMGFVAFAMGLFVRGSMISFSCYQLQLGGLNPSIVVSGIARSSRDFRRRDVRWGYFGRNWDSDDRTFALDGSDAKGRRIGRFPVKQHMDEDVSWLSLETRVSSSVLNDMPIGGISIKITVSGSFINEKDTEQRQHDGVYTLIADEILIADEVLILMWPCWFEHQLFDNLCSDGKGFRDGIQVFSVDGFPRSWLMRGVRCMNAALTSSHVDRNSRMQNYGFTTCMLNCLIGLGLLGMELSFELRKFLLFGVLGSALKMFDKRLQRRVLSGNSLTVLPFGKNAYVVYGIELKEKVVLTTCVASIERRGSFDNVEATMGLAPRFFSWFEKPRNGSCSLGGKVWMRVTSFRKSTRITTCTRHEVSGYAVVIMHESAGKDRNLECYQVPDMLITGFEPMSVNKMDGYVGCGSPSFSGLDFNLGLLIRRGGLVTHVVILGMVDLMMHRIVTWPVDAIGICTFLKHKEGISDGDNLRGLYSSFATLNNRLNGLRVVDATIIGAVGINLKGIKNAGEFIDGNPRELDDWVQRRGQMSTWLDKPGLLEAPD